MDLKSTKLPVIKDMTSIAGYVLNLLMKGMAKAVDIAGKAMQAVLGPLSGTIEAFLKFMESLSCVIGAEVVGKPAS